MRYTLTQNGLVICRYRNRTSAIGNARHIARETRQKIVVYFGDCAIAQIAW